MTLFCYLKVVWGNKRIQTCMKGKLAKGKKTQISLLDGFEFLVRLKDVRFIWTNIQFN